MNLLASLNDTVRTLVHPDVRGRPAEFASHKNFLITRLGLSFASLALAPLFWVLGTAPAAWEAGVLAWLAVPCAAALSVSRSGDLKAGEALSIVTWIGLAVTVTLGAGSGLGMVFLLMVPLEAATWQAASPVMGALGAAAVAAVALSARSRLGLRVEGGLDLAPLGSAALAGALAYAGALSLSAGMIARVRQKTEAVMRDRYRALVDTIDEVVLEFDRSGSVCGTTAVATKLFGIDPDDLLGRGFFERLQVADRPVFLKLVTDVAAGQPSRTATLRLRTGRTMPSSRGDFEEPVFAWIDLVARLPAGLGAGRRTPEAGTLRREIATVGLLRDVTGRVEQERAVAQLRTESDRTTAGRNLFLANVTHELRTPLNSIIGFAEMLSNEALMPADAAKQREYAGIIHQSGLHLLAVVNTILDAQKIESGSFDLVPEALDLGALIDACCDMMGLKAQQSGVALMRDVAGGAGDLVGDKRACKQIILNLLSNGLKFTPRGGQVTMGVRRDGNSVLITVADTGIGVASQDLPRLGDPFFQAKTSYDRPNDGTGLGLSVVRGLVGLHGGSMAIESAPGEGTRVTVRLPAGGRGGMAASTMVTKIETIARYSSTMRHGEMPGGVRMHKIA